jgi:hypothetical protein
LVSIFYIVIFILSVSYLIRYRLNIKKAAEIANEALYPRKEDEFASILIPLEWKEMGPLTKKTKSYKYVNWGTFAALVLLAVLLGIVLSTNWLGTDFLNLAFIFFLIINAVRHQGNLFILPKGIILNGKYYSRNQINSYESEQIIRWHELYGLDSRVNNAYKLTINVKKKFVQSDFIVVKDRKYLEKITTLFDQQGISGLMKTDQSKTPVGNINKS